eukprot:GFYU01020498.1.p1 GENE.GFYU01020498.1~~GFYU01020498.1.p1  ORF type:complete len:573 (-),score=23.01 GFYU01020498.1:298-1923(-)
MRTGNNNAIGGSGYGAVGNGAPTTPARTILPSALSVRDLPELPSLPPNTTASSPRTHRPAPTTSLANNAVQLPSSSSSQQQQQQSYQKCNDRKNSGQLVGDDNDDVDDDCAFSEEDDLVGGTSKSEDDDDCNFDRCAADGEEDDSSHQRLPYNCMMSDPHSTATPTGTIGGTSSPLPATPISELPLHPPPSANKPLLDSFDIVGNNSFIPGGVDTEDMASAAAAACATLHQNQQHSNNNTNADSDQQYEASYTSFKTDELGLDEDNDMEISRLGFDSIERAGCSSGGGGCGADIASDGDFQDAAVDHCAVVTVRHRETIRHDSHIRSVVVSQFLKLKNIDLRTYIDGSPYGWGKVSAGIDSIFTAVSSTAATTASSTTTSSSSTPSTSVTATTNASVAVQLLDTILQSESTKIDSYLLLEHAYGASSANSKSANNNNTAALTLEAQEGTMVHRCHISDYKYVIDSRSTHQGARRMQEHNGNTSGTYTHGMLREELERKSSTGGDHNSGSGGGGGGGTGGRGGGSIIAGTASKLFGFVRKAI